MLELLPADVAVAVQVDGAHNVVHLEQISVTLYAFRLVSSVPQLPEHIRNLKRDPVQIAPETDSTAMFTVQARYPTFRI